jgi:2-hydroxychromene-2-carboxylate isomerase
MTVIDKLKGVAINAYLGAPGQSARAAVAEARRRLSGETRRLDFYFDHTDPGSYLLAQAVERLVRAYPVELAFHLVGPPASDVDPDPELRTRHAVRDARDLAAHWDVDFAGKKEVDPNHARKVGAVLVRQRPAAEQLAIAIEMGRALWANDVKTLTILVGKFGTEAMGALPPVLASGYEALRRRGHYRGGSLGYGGDWFVGIERLSFLEARLARDTDVTAPPVLTARPADSRAPEPVAKTERVTLEMWFSFRSPFSYLALDPIADLVARYPVDLRLRPVLPLVQRGVPLPSIKRMYLARDAKREAERLGIPFGNLCDPVGVGAEHCMAIAKVAIDAGRGLEFLRSAARGIWSEALDMSSYVDLRQVVERAGLSWEVAREALGKTDWKDWAKTNAEDLGLAGLWGVPSFRVGDYVTWGQDRIPLLEDRLRRHVAASRNSP